MHKSDKLMIVILVTIAILFGWSMYRRHRLDAELGEQHCGEVEVITPSGQKAHEHQCWRSK